MKILNNNIGIQRYSANTASLKQKEAIIASSKSFDAITIHADKAEIMDSAFAKKMSDKIKNEVRNVKEPGKERLDVLKRQIDSGEYKVNIDLLIKKIMLEA